MPSSQRETRIKDLFNDAIELEPHERLAFVQREADDGDLQIHVQQMIEAHERAGSFLADPTMDGSAVPGESIGRYRLIKLIGEGGFGSVYLAQQQEPVTRTVALKVIKLGMDTQQVIKRFEAERQALAMMDHPNIASVYDAGATETGRPYFVMEYVNGKPITAYCDEHRMTVHQRLTLFQNICAAVQHAHTKGVIHRDLKPGNILVANGTLSPPTPKIIDFGIAKAISSKLTSHFVTVESSRFIGTPEYMSPEQADLNAKDVDTRSDIYSLGVLLYELLTGATPFDGSRLRSSTFDEIKRIIREEDAPKPSTRLATLNPLQSVAWHRASEPNRLASQLRGDLDWITLKAIEKDRERRYTTPLELADDLQRHMDDLPVRAGPRGSMYSFGKFVRRHRAGVVAACLASIAIICGVVGIAIGIVQARASADDARSAHRQAQAINDFMHDILTRAKPEVDGADVRLVEVIDRASIDAHSQFASHPLLEAQVRDLLGEVYADLSMWNKAKIEFKRAAKLWRTVASADDPRTIFSEMMYAANALNNLDTGEVADDLPVLLDRSVRVLGEGDATTLEVHRTIALVHFLRGRSDEADKILRTIRDRLLAEGGNDEQHIAALRTLTIIGRQRAHDPTNAVHDAILAEVEQLSIEQMQRAVRAFGPQSLLALEAQVGVAAVLADQRKFEAAATMARAALGATSARLGPCHIVRTNAMDVLARSLHRMGDSAAAAELCIAFVDCAREGDSGVLLLVAIADALPILDRGQRWAEGEMLAREYLHRAMAAGGGHNDLVFDAEAWVIRFASLQGRLDQASLMMNELKVRADAAELWGRARARMHLFEGSNLRRLGRFEEAEAELMDASKEVDGAYGTNFFNPDDILVELIALYHAWDKPEKAHEYEMVRQQLVAKSQG